MNLAEPSRREALRHLALLAAGSIAARGAAPAAPPGQAADGFPQLRMGREQIAILVYPEFTALDVLGPYYPLSGMMGATVRFVARTTAPVPAEGAAQGGFQVRPHLTFADCPSDLDLFLVPGGLKGTLDMLADPVTLEFIASCGRRAKRVASVCTGSLLLGAAGLLSGRRATSHWQTLALLKEVGALPVAERIVFDGEDRVTAAGVSAGLDLGFELVRRFRGDFYAQGMQLLGEYDPHPPFPGGGNPRTADPRVVAMLEMMHEPVVARFREALQKARPRGGGR